MLPKLAPSCSLLCADTVLLMRQTLVAGPSFLRLCAPEFTFESLPERTRVRTSTRFRACWLRLCSMS